MRRPRPRPWLLVLGLLLAGLPWLTDACFRVPRSSSAPRTLWVLTPGPPRPGGWVVACLPPALARLGRRRGYLSAGRCPERTSEVLKRVAALPGDQVAVTPFGLWVHGSWLAGPRRARDSEGRPIPSIPCGTYRVAPGTVWLYSDHSPHSWDSRYFGAVPLAGVRSNAQPLPWATDDDERGR